MIRNVGNIDIEVGGQTVTLRMRHVVRGHPGVVLAAAEAAKLAEILGQMATLPQVLTPTTSIDVDAAQHCSSPRPGPLPSSLDDLLS